PLSRHSRIRSPHRASVSFVMRVSLQPHPSARKNASSRSAYDKIAVGVPEQTRTDASGGKLTRVDQTFVKVMLDLDPKAAGPHWYLVTASKDQGNGRATCQLDAVKEGFCTHIELEDRGNGQGPAPAANPGSTKKYSYDLVISPTQGQGLW